MDHHSLQSPYQSLGFRFLTSGGNDESHRKSLLCVQTEPTRWEAAKTEGKQNTCTCTPSQYNQSCTAHKPISETHSLHAGLVGIPVPSVEEKALKCLSCLYHCPCHHSPPCPRSHPQLHPPHKSCKTNQTGSLASLLSSGILPKTSSSSFIYQPVILIFLDFIYSLLIPDFGPFLAYVLV